MTAISSLVRRGLRGESPADKIASQERIRAKKRQRHNVRSMAYEVRGQLALNPREH
jgi:hypothetical protein